MDARRTRPSGRRHSSGGVVRAQAVQFGLQPPSDAVPLAFNRVERGGIEVDRVRLLQLRDELRTEEAELLETLDAVRAARLGVEKLLARSAPSDNPPASHVPAERPSSPVPSDDPGVAVPAASLTDKDRATPRGSQAVEVILTEAGSWMTAQELAAAQIERGWPPESSDPVSAVRAAANRLVASKPDLFVREHGSYRYQGQSDRGPSLDGEGPEAFQAKASIPQMDRPSLVTDGQTRGDWRTLPRTEAVARMLIEAGEPLSPSELSRMLQEVGRDDSPLAVGKALDHLRGKRQATTIGRGQWVLTGRDDLPSAQPAQTNETEQSATTPPAQGSGSEYLGPHRVVPSGSTPED
jgi:hypothetical protein